MKVLFLVSNLMSGGVERTVTYIAEYFANHNVDTTILSISDEVFYTVEKPVNLVTLGISRSYKNIADKLIKAAKRYINVNKYISRSKCDVVFCMTPEMIRYISPFKINKDFSLISSERNNPLYDNDSDKKIKAKVFPKCDGIVFQTERAKNYFDKDIQAKGVVIPNAVGNELAYKLNAKDVKQKKISAVGRLSAQKDYPTMIKAFSVFLESHPDYRLEIYGAGPENDNLMNMINEMHLSKNIIFMGTSKTALKAISDSACYLMSSIYEGMPNALMEAMAIGLPCISTDCPFGPAELIKSGENGVLVDVGDYIGMARSLSELIDNEQTRVQIGYNAKKIIMTNSIDVVAEKYLKYVLEISSMKT